VRRTALLLLASALILAACSQTEPAEILELARADHSWTILHTFQAPDLSHPAPVDVVGSHATMVTTDRGVSITAKTNGLPVDPALGIGVYTMWIVVFNYPDLCSDGECGINDLVPFGGDPAVGGSVLRGGNSMVSKGKGNIAGQLAVGDTSEALFGPGLMEGRARLAEKHFILRYHGPPMPGYVAEQLHEVWGGCDVDSEGMLPVGVGFPCYDPQAGAFLN
jgi:hypothetical protein